MTAAQSLGTFFVLPAIIALLGGYMICREEQDDTLKSLKLIPINEIRLTCAKMLVALLFSITIYLLLFVITILTEFILHFEQFNFEVIFRFLKMYFLNGLCMFLAISPIIALVTLIKKSYWLALVFAEIYSFSALFIGILGDVGAFHPVIASFNITGYYSATPKQMIISIASLLICAVLAYSLLFTAQKKKTSY